MMHGVSPESIPRYAPPTQWELEEMFGDLYDDDDEWDPVEYDDDDEEEEGE